MNLLEKIKEIKGKYTDPIDSPAVEAWESQVKRLLVTESIADSEPIQLLVTSLEKEVAEMDRVLLSSDSIALPDSLRDRTIDKKMLYLQVIDYFNVTEMRKSLETQLTNP